MNKNQSIKIFLLLAILMLSNAVFSQKQAKIYHFTLNQEIDRAAYRLVKKAVREAEAQKADYIVMTLNTYGGLMDAADSIPPSVDAPVDNSTFPGFDNSTIRQLFVGTVHSR